MHWKSYENLSCHVIVPIYFHPLRTLCQSFFVISLFWNQELQRRLDQTLGKPGSYLAGIDRVGNVKPMTVGARLYRVEQQLSQMDKKLDQLVHTLNQISHLPHPKSHTIQGTSAAASSSSTSSNMGPLQLPPAPIQHHSPVPLASIEDDV